MAEHRPAVEARERQIDQKILRPLGGDLRPGLGAGRALDQAEGPLEAAQGADNVSGFRELVDIGQAATSRKKSISGWSSAL